MYQKYMGKNWIKKGAREISIKAWVLPFLLALGGVAADYATTVVGLGMGFYETHPHYHPAWALLIFWGAISILTLTLPKKRPWTFGVNGLALASYLGAVNNILVILGLFPGLQI